MISGIAKTFDKKFAFSVSVFGWEDAAFSKCSSLEVDVAEVKQYEGGSLIPQKSPGRLDFKDITLERGVSFFNRDALIWFTTIALGPLSTEPFLKKAVTIRQHDRVGFITKEYLLVNAWPKSFTAGEWDNTVDENVIEKMVLCYDFFVPIG